MKSKLEIRKIGDGVFQHKTQDGEILIDSKVGYFARNINFSVVGQKQEFSYSYNQIEVYDDTDLGIKEIGFDFNSLPLRLKELGYTTSDTKLDSIILNTTNLLTDAQLRASAVPISPRPNTTGSNGTTPYKLISLATTNANIVKASGGNLYSIVAIGLSSTVKYLKLYNKATLPTVGTDIPVMTIPIPANTQGAGISIPFSMGVNFPLGISIAITAGSADNDSVAILANEVLVNLTYA